jgi:hypothetical protein
MALVNVYDPQGNEHEKETTDARECVREMGWTMEPPETGGPVFEEGVEVSEPKGKKGKKG